MKKTGQLLFALAATVFVAGIATCYFGVDHEIAKIPPDVRAGMTDTDWVGTEWVALGMGVSACGVGILVIAFAFRAWVRSRPVAPGALRRDGA